MAFETYTPIEYLKIDIASNYGHDKKSWQDRIDWFDDNLQDILDVPSMILETATRRKGTPILLKQAEEPALFYAGCKAYADALMGKEISYPISLDATASGAQLLATLINCEKSAKLCNVIDTGDREDLYTNIFDEMVQRIGSDSMTTRNDAKEAIMSALYGSTAVPKRVFGDGELYRIFLTTMEEEATGIWALNKALLSLWQPDVLSHDWVLPDNFHVKIKVMAKTEETVQFLDTPHEVTYYVNAPEETGLSIGANTTHSIDGMVVREMVRRCSFDPATKVRAMEASILHSETDLVCGSTTNIRMVQTLLAHYDSTGFLSARIIDHVTQDTIAMFTDVQNEALWELLESMPEKPFEVLCVHDCFRVLPNYGNDLRRQYNRILYEIAKSDLLSSIASQITGSKQEVTKYGDISSQVLEANYALS